MPIYPVDTRSPECLLLTETAVLTERRPLDRAKLWGAAERDVITRLRRHALKAWGLPRSDVHLTAYWTVDHAQDSDA
ncbi:SIP domain-containing protein [Stackebrandtia soli]|uniref:SIP domain-containing protein n=1 Tax=Stackebrandtia soli TaxID=1892856 RepID=UPI0039E9D4B6